jgi:hypothetical protein
VTGNDFFLPVFVLFVSPPPLFLLVCNDSIVPGQTTAYVEKGLRRVFEPESRADISIPHIDLRCSVKTEHLDGGIAGSPTTRSRSPRANRRGAKYCPRHLLVAMVKSQL